MNMKNSKWWAWIVLCAVVHAAPTEHFGGSVIPGSWLEFFVDVVFGGNIVFCISKMEK